LTKVITTATWQGSEPLLFEELFVSPDSIYYSDIYYVMSVLVIHLHLFILVSFYTSLASSTLVMGIYMVLIYRNYQKDLRQMYRGDFSFLPKNARKHDNKNFVVSILFCRLDVCLATLFIRDMKLINDRNLTKCFFLSFPMHRPILDNNREA
jgi:hypothetical protein